MTIFFHMWCGFGQDRAMGDGWGGVTNQSSESRHLTSLQSHVTLTGLLTAPSLLSSTLAWSASRWPSIIHSHFANIVSLSFMPPSHRYLRLKRRNAKLFHTHCHKNRERHAVIEGHKTLCVLYLNERDTADRQRQFQDCKGQFWRNLHLKEYTLKTHTTFYRET